MRALVAAGVLSLCFNLSTAQTGNLTLPLVLDSGMVLQRGPAQSQLWGWSTPNDTIVVTLSGHTLPPTTVDSSGLFRVLLPATAASIGHRIDVTDGNETKVLEDVAFGDVFLCSGQSHMTFSVNQDLNGVWISNH